MLRKTFAIGLTLLLALVTFMPASAITGGKPDGNGHPYGALLLVPGYTFCSGTLIDEDVVLTAGHCTSFWSDPAAEINEVWVTFDSEASVDPVNWDITGGTWYLAHTWETIPTYVDADWPFTTDYGVVFLDEDVAGITPAELPSVGLLDDLIGNTGQTGYRFYDVGYGQDGVNVGGGPYMRNFEFIRKVSEQRFNPSKGSVGTLDPLWLILGDSPTDQHGAGCGGDSGSGIFLDPNGMYHDIVVAVHTGGYRLGYLGRLCGRITSLNHRLDHPDILAWIKNFID